MENLDIEGIFWLAAKPDNKVAGRLKFDAIKGADLSLIGSFHNQLSPGKTELEDLFGSERPVRIQGIAGTKTLTLCDSVQSKMTMNIPGIGQEAYHSPLLLTGHHFNEEDPIGVQAVNVRLRPLESWIANQASK